MFLHANFLHIFGNMIYLWVFGDNIEDVFGHAGYFFFYSLCGIVAGLTQILSMTSFSPDDYVLGASGAISGVLGAYIVLFPTSRIQTLILAGFPVIVPLPAILFLGIWFVLQWVSSFYDLSGGVAYWAHIGGFILGMVLAAAFGLRRKKARELRYRPHGFV
jgi:membrane associated rhomboid family serine protease